MLRESVIATRIKERIAVKEKELADVDARIDHAEDVLSQLQVQRAALVLGIDEDTELLADAAPKKVRAKKTGADKQEGTQS